MIEIIQAIGLYILVPAGAFGCLGLFLFLMFKE